MVQFLNVSGTRPSDDFNLRSIGMFRRKSEIAVQYGNKEFV